MLEAKSYAIHVPSSKGAITATARAEDANAKVHINGLPAPNARPSGLLPLEHGLNRIEVVITAEDGETQKLHELKVIRAYPRPNWVKVLDQGPFAPRDSCGEIVHGGRMWLFGGYIPDVVGDIWSSGDGVIWERAGEMPNGDTINIPTTFEHDGRMWIASCQGRLYSSGNGTQWDLVRDQLPWTGATGGAVLKGRMWAIGGREGREVWSSADGVEWTQEVTEAPWSQRQNMGNVVAHDGRLWVIGGCLGRYQPYKAYSDVWSSEDGVNWIQVTDHAPWPARRWTCCVVYRNRIWLLGGFRGQPTWQNLNDVWYSANGTDWQQLETDDVWSPRHELSGYAHDGKLWVVAGNAWPLVNDAWHLDIPGMTFMTHPVEEEYVGARYEYRPRADFNESAGSIRYRLVQKPEWLSIDEMTGVISGTPPATGEFPVVLEAFDDVGETARQSYAVIVVGL